MQNARTILHLAFINELGDSYHRVRWPGAAIAQRHPDWRIIALDRHAAERFIWGIEADLLVLGNPSDVDLVPLVEARRAAGKPTVVEYNDNFFEPPAWSPRTDLWKTPPLWPVFEQLMRLGDALVVTGVGLRRRFAQVVPDEKIVTIENHMPAMPSEFDAIEHKRSNTLVLAWGGSQGHMADLLAVSPVLRELLEEFPQLTLQIMGHPSIPKLIRLPESRVRFSPWSSMNEYLDFWKRAHIGIAPLLDTPYNRSRSDVKAVEMGWSGVLPLLPRLTPYDEFAVQTGLKRYGDPADLKAQLRTYLQDPALRIRDARRVHEYVAANRVHMQRADRAQLYERLMSQPASAYCWTMPVGYHEIKGTAKESPSREALSAVHLHAMKHEYQKAFDRLQAARKHNPHDPELAVAEIHIVAALKSGDTRTRLEALQQEFPREVRLGLAAVSLADPNHRQTAWRSFLAKFEALPKAVVDFHFVHVAELLSQHIRQDSSLVPMGETFLERYPGAATVRFALAQAHEAAGHDHEALKHFSKLCAEHAQYDQGGDFYGKHERYYFTAWQAALDARVAMLGRKHG